DVAGGWGWVAGWLAWQVCQLRWGGLPCAPGGSGGPQCPAGLVVTQSEDCEPGPVEGCGAGDQVGGDAGQPAGAGPAGGPGPAGEVGDLALDDGPVRPVALLPGRVTLGGAGALQHRLVRVDGDGAPRAWRRCTPDAAGSRRARDGTMPCRRRVRWA